MGLPNKDQIDFEIKLRNYKNLSDFYSIRPWIYPAVKEFNPSRQFEIKRKDVQLLNPEFKTEFKDKFAQRNVSYIIDQLQTATPDIVKWQCSLRGASKSKPARK